MPLYYHPLAKGGYYHPLAKGGYYHKKEMLDFIQGLRDERL